MAGVRRASETELTSSVVAQQVHGVGDPRADTSTSVCLQHEPTLRRSATGTMRWPAPKSPRPCAAQLPRRTDRLHPRLSAASGTASDPGRNARPRQARPVRHLAQPATHPAEDLQRDQIAAKTATTSRHTPDPDPAVLPGREHRHRTKCAENTKFVEELTRPEFRAPNVDIGQTDGRTHDDGSVGPMNTGFFSSCGTAAQQRRKTAILLHGIRDLAYFPRIVQRCRADRSGD